METVTITLPHEIVARLEKQLLEAQGSLANFNNAMVRQKDVIYNEATGVELLEKADDSPCELLFPRIDRLLIQLGTVRLFWMTNTYGYKVNEICEIIERTLRNRKDKLDRKPAQLRRCEELTAAVWKLRA